MDSFLALKDANDDGGHTYQQSASAQSAQLSLKDGVFRSITNCLAFIRSGSCDYHDSFSHNSGVHNLDELKWHFRVPNPSGPVSTPDSHTSSGRTPFPALPLDPAPI